MRKMKTAALFLTLLLLTSSCAGNTKPVDDDTASSDAGTSASVVSDTAVQESTETGRENTPDNLPADLNFGGESVRVLVRAKTLEHNDSYQRLDVMGTDNSGDNVADAVWERNILVEERLGIDFEFIPTGGENGNEVRDIIQQSVMAASDDYDYIDTSGNTVVYSGLNSYMRDLSKAPYIDYDQPWWWSYAIEALSMDGKAYHFLCGDANLVCYIQTGVMYANLDLYEDIYGDSDELYNMVLDGKWTIDRLTELVSGAYRDNGDGVPNVGDTFGMLRTVKTQDITPHFAEGFDIRMSSWDESGMKIDIDLDRTTTAIEKLYNLYYETSGVWQSTANVNGSDVFFAEGNILFFPGRFMHVFQDALRTMTQDYAVLPFPKLNEEQENYITLAHNSGTVICVPKTVGDAKMEVVGATLEAVMAQSYRTVVPQFIETSLKTKYARDSITGQTIDLILAGITKNTLDEYSVYLKDIYKVCIVNPADRGSGVSSAYSKLVAPAQKLWDETVAKLAAETGK